MVNLGRLSFTRPLQATPSTSPSLVHISRPQSGRIGSRRGAASEQGQGSCGRRQSDTAMQIEVAPRSRSGSRVTSRRQPVQSLFTTQQQGSRRGFVSAVRTSSLVDLLGEGNLRQVHAVIEACDRDDDGHLITTELKVLLNLLGLSDSETNDAIKRGRTQSIESADGGIRISYARVLRSFRPEILSCVSRDQLPSSEFITRCKRLKNGFKKIDGDGDGFITMAELEIAMQKLDFALTATDLHAVLTTLDRDGDGLVDWSDFVDAAHTDSLAEVTSSLPEFFSIDIFCELPTFIRPAAAVSATATGPLPGMILQGSTRRSLVVLESRAINRLSFILTGRSSFIAPSEKTQSLTIPGSSVAEANTTAIERLGVEYLTRFSMEHLTQTRTSSASVAPSPRQRNTTGSGFSPTVRRQLHLIEAAAVVAGSLAGILCGLLSIWFENLVLSAGVDDQSSLYYVFIVLINVVVSLLEVNAMYATAVYCAFRMTVCTSLKLYPQDAERQFLTRSIARAALQVGHRKSKLFGIDPMKGSPRFVLLMSFVVYKSKRYMLKFLLKLFIKRVLWRAAAKSVLSLLVLPINGLMNAWTLRGVMRMCRVGIIGPPCATALLESFFVEHGEAMSPFQRVDSVRVLGCALVSKRCVHPNLEIMVEQMRHRWLKPELWPVADGCVCLDPTDETCPRHALDDIDLLLGGLRLYASQVNGLAGESVQQHVYNMVYLLIVALVIDGDVDWSERRLYVRVCEAAGLVNAWSSVLKLKRGFLDGRGIRKEDVTAMIQAAPVDTEGDGQQHVPWRESLEYSINRLARFVAW